MYVRVRKTGTSEVGDKVLNISKATVIQELRDLIQHQIGVPSEQQMLFYNGKKLSDDYRVVDYNIQLNDVIQLMVRPLEEEIKKHIEKYLPNDYKNKETTIETESKYYKVGDLVDVRFIENNGAWYEGTIIKICKPKDSKDNKFQEYEEKHLMFTVRSKGQVEAFETHTKFNNIRPRSYYTYKTKELEKGMVVLANCNIENPKRRGQWFDLKIESVSAISVKGTILANDVSIKNYSLGFKSDIMRIEIPCSVSERNRKEELQQALSPTRKYPYYCENCKDIKSRKCQECGCKVCSGKNDYDKILLCDECDYGYHLTCLDPPLQKIPEEDEWYCPECKTDDSEIVKAGEKLKVNKKKAKLPSSRGECSRNWGRGMACVGRTKECTIVPKDHFGPIPGIEVGTCWKFRFQVSEAGVHRPLVAGIHGRATGGAYSLVLSGVYEDNDDHGIEFYYTGSGGRNLLKSRSSSGQSCDQTLTRQNKALALSCAAPFNHEIGAESKNWKKGKPVRVIRNYKGAKKSKYAPKDGNRYDGIYKVVRYYPEIGKSGFMVWKYLLRRHDPIPAPWEKDGQELEIIYPSGYLEAKKAQEEMSNKKNKSKMLKSPSSSKRKILTHISRRRPKTPKLQEYKFSSDVELLINKDKYNEKLWSKCKEVVIEGKQRFLEKVAEVFMCICCQDILFKPITMACKHNICQSCLMRSFASEIYSCPSCRMDLKKNYKMKVNKVLDKILLLLFPGYSAGR